MAYLRLYRSPDRIRSILAALQPVEADLGNANHRSPGIQMIIVGNELLAAAVQHSAYAGGTSHLHRVGKRAPN